MSIVNLQKKYSSLPPFDVDILLASAANISKEFLYAHPEYHLSAGARFRFYYFIFLYKKGYSVATIIGHKEFYGLDFLINKHVLVPRPDTEIMVTEAIDILKAHTPTATLIDIGTGSGCIPISILKHSSDSIPAFAIDISWRALRIAKKNAQKYKVKIKFLHGNLLRPFPRQPSLQNQYETAIITANLPYLTEDQFANEPSIQREPKHALVAHHNGLGLYENLLCEVKKFSYFSNIFLLLEIDPSQSEPIKKIVHTHLPHATLEIKKDLSGFDRLIIIHQQSIY